MSKCYEEAIYKSKIIIFRLINKELLTKTSIYYLSN